MILKASQRGGTRQLAAHLLKTEENEHVEIHEIRGFLSDTLPEALQEIHSISRGTRCKQFMFSISLNPPQTENIPIQYFENALTEIEKEMKLEGQPRVVVFHEKEGRRHAHCVWSRINVDEMKAIHLPYYKFKLRDISKQLYLQHGWKLPKGLIDSKNRDPLNFTLAEWQQAKRMNEDPKGLKSLFQECWAVSDSGKAFQQALKERGFWLARGDRRGFVAVDFQGEVFSLSRWTGVKNKELKNRLGGRQDLSSMEEVKTEISKRMTDKLETYIRDTQARMQKEKEPLVRRKQALRNHHHKQRQALKQSQSERWEKETLERSQRLPKGLKSVWYRLTGKYQKLKADNNSQVETCRKRDREEQHTLITRQLKERQKLQKHIEEFKESYKTQMLELRQDIAHYTEMGGKLPEQQTKDLRHAFEKTYEPTL